MIVKVGAVQQQIKHQDIESNLKTAMNFIKKAHKEECDFLLFPELFLTGLGVYSENIKKNVRDKYTDTIPGKFTEKFSKLAEEHSMHIIMGSIMERKNSSLYNTSVLISDSGKIIGKFRKNKLWVIENNYAKPGKSRPVFKTKYCKVVIMICNDLVFPEVTRDMALNDAEILFIPSAWSHEDKYGILKYNKSEEWKKIPNGMTEGKILDALVPARAIENNISVVYSNPIGVYEAENFKLHFVGHSQVAMPVYSTIANMKNKEGLLTAEIDLELAKIAEQAYNFRSMADGSNN